MAELADACQFRSVWATPWRFKSSPAPSELRNLPAGFAALLCVCYTFPMTSYTTIAGRATEIEEKKSRFIASLAHVETEDEAGVPRGDPRR